MILTHLPLVIIPEQEEFYKLTKNVASSKRFHTQIVKIKTLDEIYEKTGNNKDKDSTLANICGGVYAEFSIQKMVNEGKIIGPVTWILDEPADAKGESMYVGLDISTKKGVEGAAFIMFDPYGMFIDARKIELKSETLGYDDYYEIFRYMIKGAKERRLKRLVILRDGFPKSYKELNDCIQAFNKVKNDLNYELSLQYVGVLKRSKIRVFYKDANGKIVNPLQGSYAYLFKIKHLGYHAHEIIVATSKTPTGTVRPVILRVYELPQQGNKLDLDEAKRIAEEYVSLARLNFWNLTTGSSKLALPIKVADILSYLLSMGIPVNI